MTTKKKPGKPHTTDASLHLRISQLEQEVQQLLGAGKQDKAELAEQDRVQQIKNRQIDQLCNTLYHTRRDLERQQQKPVRVLRLIEYSGERSLVEQAVRDAIHGTKRPRHGLAITAVTLHDYPEILLNARLADADKRQEAEAGEPGPVPSGKTDANVSGPRDGR